MHNLSRSIKVVVAGGGANGTGAIWTPVAVDCTGGFDRAMIVVSRGNPEGTIQGLVSASVYKSATSGGSYALVSGSLGTAGTLAGTSGGNNTALIVDMAVDPAAPFLKIYGTGASTSGTAAIPATATVLLYRGTRSMPPTQDNAVKQVS